MAHPRARSPHVCLRQRRYSENPPGPEHKSANRNILESSFPSFSLPIEGSSFVAVNANWESILANFTDARFMKIDEPTSSYGLQRWRALPKTSWGTARNFFCFINNKNAQRQNETSGESGTSIRFCVMAKIWYLALNEIVDDSFDAKEI